MDSDLNIFSFARLPSFWWNVSAWFCPISNWIACFFNAEFLEFFYVMGISLLLNMWNANIFSQHVACFLILLKVSHEEKINFGKVNWSISPFMSMLFVSWLCLKDFLLSHLLKVLEFYILQLKQDSFLYFFNTVRFRLRGFSPLLISNCFSILLKRLSFPHCVSFYFIVVKLVLHKTSCFNNVCISVILSALTLVFFF